MHRLLITHSGHFKYTKEMHFASCIILVLIQCHKYFTYSQTGHTVVSDEQAAAVNVDQSLTSLSCFVGSLPYLYIHEVSLVALSGVMAVCSQVLILALCACVNEWQQICRRKQPPPKNFHCWCLAEDISATLSDDVEVIANNRCVCCQMLVMLGLSHHCQSSRT